MSTISQEIELLLSKNKRKKYAVIITTDANNLEILKSKKLMEGIYSASINYKQLQALKEDANLLGVELDSEMTV